MSTESQSEGGFPALSKIMSEDDYNHRINNYPYDVLRHHVRTVRDLERAIETLVNVCPTNKPDDIESLILTLHREATEGDARIRHFFSNAKKKVIEWYATREHWNGWQRSYTDTVRAFRFLIGAVTDMRNFGGGEISFYTPINQTFLCDPDNKSINEMIKNNPCLYWSHQRYQTHLTWVISHITERFERNKDSRYDKHYWLQLERILRRVIEAGDWDHIEAISKILSLYDEKEIPPYSSRIDKADAVLIYGERRANLSDTVEFLKERKKSDLSQDPQEFGLILKREAGLRSSVMVHVDYPRPIIVPDENSLNLVKFSINIFCNNSEVDKLAHVLKFVRVYLTIDGGYTVGSVLPYPDNRKNGVFIGDSAPDRFVGGGFRETDKLNFNFVPFVGRSRLTLRLIFSHQGGKGDEEIVVPFFVETEVASEPEEEVVV